MTGSFRDLTVYKKTFTLAMQIFEVTKKFPPGKNMLCQTRSGDHRDPYAELLAKDTGSASIPSIFPAK